MEINIDSLLSAMSAEDLRNFVMSYSKSNPSFIESLDEYSKRTSKEQTTFDYEKAVKECFNHYYKAPVWEHDWNHPRYLDWDLVGQDLKKVIRKASSAIDAGHPELAVETSFLILDIDDRMYEDDFLCEREDWSADDLCLDECFELIEKAMKSPLMTKDHLLKICERLQKFYKSDLLDFIQYNIDNLIEDTRSSLLTENEYLEIKLREFNAEQGWRKSSMACDIWNYLLETGQIDEAESFFQEHRDFDELRRIFVDYKLEAGRLDEAMASIDEGILLAQNKNQFGLVRHWREKKLDLLEGMGDPLAASVCLALFADSFGDSALEYYHRAKSLVTPEEWPDYRTKLLSSNKELQYSADSALADIYREEALLDCLYSHLLNAKSNLLSALSRFARLFTPEQQETLIGIVRKNFAMTLGYNPNRKSYRELACKISTISRTCPAGKKLAKEILDAFRSKYQNRPALLEELEKVKI